MFRQGVLARLPSWYRDQVVSDAAMYLLFAEHGLVGSVGDVMGVWRVHAGGYWSSLSRAEQDRIELRFYDRVPSWLGARYEAGARAKSAHYESLLRADEQQVRMNARHRDRKVQGLTSEAVRAHMHDVIATTVPRQAIVVVVTEGDASLLPCGNITAWQFCPVEGARPRFGRLIAEGKHGRFTLPAVANGCAWEFRLYGAGHPAELLAAATVVRGDEGWAAATAPEDAAGGRPFLIAQPNPVGVDGVGQSSEVSWSAGDAAAAKLYLASVRRVDDYLPYGGDVAVACLEALQHQGATHLVMPDTARWWLTAFPELADHLERRCRLLADDDACSVYALL